MSKNICVFYSSLHKERKLQKMSFYPFDNYHILPTHYDFNVPNCHRLSLLYNSNPISFVFPSIVSKYHWNMLNVKFLDQQISSGKAIIQASFAIVMGENMLQWLHICGL